MTVIGALVVVGGVVAALVFLLGDDKDSKDDAKKSGSPSMSTSATASRSSSSSPTPTDTATTRSATPTRTPTTGRPTATGTGGTSVESVQLNVGECINLDTITGNIDKVSCTTPHDMQVLKNFQMPGSVYPSDSDFQDEVSTQCDSVLTSTVSREPNPSKYTLKFSYPQEPSWDRGDREVTCLVQDASEAKISKKLG
ncbi:MAG: hypothetical protein HOV68_08870 [Streptomycetaceae bacterium]|nr:hypothetical protein [Streptomycetaceae bacterium]